MNTTSANGRHDGYALAYREARMGLEDQERSVVELRARAGALIAAAAITTSFFGGQTLAKHDIGAAAWIAIVCFVLLGFAVLGVLWPRRDWEFSLAPDQFIATYLEPTEGEPLALHLIERDLALHMGRSAELNRDQLGALMGVFRVGAALLMVEVVWHGWLPWWCSGKLTGCLASRFRSRPPRPLALSLCALAPWSARPAAATSRVVSRVAPDAPLLLRRSYPIAQTPRRVDPILAGMEDEDRVPIGVEDDRLSP